MGQCFSAKSAESQAPGGIGAMGPPRMGPDAVENQLFQSEEGAGPLFPSRVTPEKLATQRSQVGQSESLPDGSITDERAEDAAKSPTRVSGPNQIATNQQVAPRPMPLRCTQKLHRLDARVYQAQCSGRTNCRRYCVPALLCADQRAATSPVGERAHAFQENGHAT